MDPDLAQGAQNLLLHCAGLKTGARLLIVHENPRYGWYDLDAPLAVAAQATAMGMLPTLLEVGAPDNDRDPCVAEAIAAHDCSIFFARIGDQDRFADQLPGKTSVMCYVRDAQMLASPYGRTDHRALVELKIAVNDILLGADRIEITCPLGTGFTGNISGPDRESRADVSIHRFPLGVPQPISASGFSGEIALARYLTPTGSRVYDPAFLVLDSPVLAQVESGRTTGFTGDTGVVRRVRAHQAMVAELFGIDGEVVHSWHAGIHPGSVYTADAARDPDRWSNSVFTSPRFLHLHTCGNYAPGEICWMVLDPTVAVDGRNLWETGRLGVHAFSRIRRCLDRWPELSTLFARPVDLVGLAQ